MTSKDIQKLNDQLNIITSKLDTLFELGVDQRVTQAFEIIDERLRQIKFHNQKNLRELSVKDVNLSSYNWFKIDLNVRINKYKSLIKEIEDIKESLSEEKVNLLYLKERNQMEEIFNAAYNEDGFIIDEDEKTSVNKHTPNLMTSADVINELKSELDYYKSTIADLIRIGIIELQELYEPVESNIDYRIKSHLNLKDLFFFMNVFLSAVMEEGKYKKDLKSKAATIVTTFFKKETRDKKPSSKALLNNEIDGSALNSVQVILEDMRNEVAKMKKKTESNKKQK